MQYLGFIIIYYHHHWGDFIQTLYIYDFTIQKPDETGLH